MSGTGARRSWKRLAVLAVAALVLAVLGVLIARALDEPPGGEGGCWSTATAHPGPDCD
ncbi:hypothetical protein [Streptomyces sp. NPDC020917]|uniref:hypothetical protein n=1 Tax=Streptomyces sp. NPDC020917 TaxID=3365102 RepID=UPI00379F8C37